VAEGAPQCLKRKAQAVAPRVRCVNVLSLMRTGMRAADELDKHLSACGEAAVIASWHDRESHPVPNSIVKWTST